MTGLNDAENYTSTKVTEFISWEGSHLEVSQHLK